MATGTSQAAPAGGLLRWTLRARAGSERVPGEPRRMAYLYILPAYVFYGTFVLVPLLHSVLLSFYNWDGVTPKTWAGLTNYRQILSDPEIRHSFVHSAVLVIFFSAVPVLIGLLLASALSRMPVFGLTGFRAVLFLPQIIPAVVIGVIWRWIYEPEGPLNKSLEAVGLGSFSRAWLGDFSWALPSIGVIGSWVTYGFCMVLFIAGVQKIPTSLYDAARVDGAGPLREFFHVTLPGLRNEIAVVLTITMIWALRTFDLIYVTTKGGPGNATEVPAFALYTRAFQTGQVGSAAAIGVVLALLIFVIVFLVTRVSERES
ncbi:MAG TPA: sugar ABC transporter permease [Gaiellaceae bacterium]|jgi:raffinose/stachyose/melibiose transport system permease protein